jgi:predicted nucleic acid-binding protein
LLCSARSEADYRALEQDLAQFRDLRMDAKTFAVALGAQRQLAASGHHRIAIPDVLIAACAQQHSADVLHVDRHYETLARVLAFTPVRA